MKQYYYLMRMDKPIGIVLLLWPTLWALWLASHGKPNWHLVIIFMVGVVLMRSAGCVINDIADRHVDRHVARTRDRPLAAKKISMQEAWGLFVILMSVAFILVLQLNRLTILLSLVGAILAIVYPFLKRVTHLPQFGLGLAFSWGIPMAFAAENNTVSSAGWFLFATAACWPIIYDTMYAMVDREDDKKIQVKSTAILFGQYDRLVLAILQGIFLGLLIMVGSVFGLHWSYYFSVMIVAGFFVYQQRLLKNPQYYFAAFFNHRWIGAMIFFGIVSSYYL